MGEVVTADRVLCSFGGDRDSGGCVVDPPPPLGVGSWLCPCGVVAPIAGRPVRYLPHYEGKQGGVRYSRVLTDKERDVLKVAAEMVRARYDDDVPDGVAERLLGWAMRLKASHDELLHSLRVPDAAPAPDSLGAALARFAQLGGTP